MRCTEAYLQELPCDLPYMLDENGECTMLVEAHIQARGPSRAIFMAYQFAVALLALYLNGMRLAELLADPALRRRRKGLHVLREPEIAVLVLVIYGTVMTLLQAIDVDGYGGRLPYAVWLYLESQAMTAFLSAGVGTLCIWYTVLAELECEQTRQRRVARVVCAAGACMGLSFFVLPALEIYLRPSNAALGVHNGPIVALKSAILTGLITITAKQLTLEYWRQAKARKLHLRETTSRRKSSGAVTPSTQLRTPTMSATSADKNTRSPISATTSPARVSLIQLQNPPPCTPRRSSFSASGGGSSATVMTEAALHQMQKLVLAGLVVSAVSLATTVGAAMEATRCWVWKRPPDSQWWGLTASILLLSIVVLTLLPMKTHWLCQRIRIPADDEEEVAEECESPGVGPSRRSDVALPHRSAASLPSAFILNEILRPLAPSAQPHHLPPLILPRSPLPLEP